MGQGRFSSFKSTFIPLFLKVEDKKQIPFLHIFSQVGNKISNCSSLKKMGQERFFSFKSPSVTPFYKNGKNPDLPKKFDIVFDYS